LLNAFTDNKLLITDCKLPVVTFIFVAPRIPMLPEELLQHISNGDNAAFRQLYELFKDRVFNTCLSYLQQHEEAEEATQDVFIEVHHSAAKFKGNSSVATWVYRIAVNKCLDRIRYRGRQKRFAFISGLFSNTSGELIYDPPTFDHPGIVAENKEKARILFGAIRQLPENQQTAFILKQAEGLSQREVASIMNISEKAVESLLQRAKMALRKILEKHEGFN
jgi:RNA polymerase sigma factor (sigma-70 family)